MNTPEIKDLDGNLLEHDGQAFVADGFAVGPCGSGDGVLHLYLLDEGGKMKAVGCLPLDAAMKMMDDFARAVAPHLIDALTSATARKH